MPIPSRANCLLTRDAAGEFLPSVNPWTKIPQPRTSPSGRSIDPASSGPTTLLNLTSSDTLRSLRPAVRGGRRADEQLGDLLGKVRGELAPAVLVAVDAGQGAGLVVAVHDLDVLGGDESRVGDADSRRDLHQLPAQGAQVDSGPGSLRGRVKAAGQPLVLGGDAGGALVGVALLRLDAADRQHRLTGHVDHVGAQGEG